MTKKERTIIDDTIDLLDKYKITVAEMQNLKIAIEENQDEEYMGCSAIKYSESNGKTNKFNSSVENEVISRESDERIKKLKRELKNKQMILQKIGNALETLTDREYDIINLKYFKKLKTWEKVGEKLELTGEYCRDLNTKIVNKLSKVIFIDKYIQ